MRSVLFAVLAATFSAGVAFAGPNDQGTPTRTTLPTSVPVSTLNTTLIDSVAAPTFGPMRLAAGYKSNNTAGRTAEISDKNGRRYKMKNEFYAGLIHTSGWGMSVMGVQNGETFADDTKSHYSDGDPSVTLVHPVLYQSDNMKITGQFRKYFAESPRSLDRNQNQYAYYMFTTYALGKGWNIWNQLTPRYFQQSYYKPTDSKYYAEDYTTIAKTQNNWFKYGLGQHTQVESHDQTTTGTVAEIYPFVDFVFSNNIYIEPRFYMPVYRDGAGVYDSPNSVSIDQSQAELFVQVSI